MSAPKSRPPLDDGELLEQAVGACASLGAAVRHVDQARLHLRAVGASTEHVDRCDAALRDAVNHARVLVRDGVK